MKKYVVWYELGAERYWVGSFDTAEEAALNVVPVERGRFSLLEFPVFEGETPLPDWMRV
jgi:hypothetical protein